MLPKEFRDRINQLIHPRFDECREQLKGDFSRKSAEMAARGHLHTSASFTAHHEACVKQVEARIAIVWDAIQRVTSALAVPYSNTLAQELKAELQYYVPLSLWQLPESYPKLGLLTEAKIVADLHQDLRVKAERQLQKVAAEIELYVDGLRTKQETAPKAPSKEYDQKFQILFSPGQAQRDFEEWQKQLGPAGASIAVMFVDIDDFKSLNTRHTETKIDNTALPEAMRLLARLVRFRGEAYRQGGDEFIVITPNHDISEANAFGEKIRSSFEQHSFTVERQTEKITVSIGIASCPRHGETYEEVLQQANNAKKEAKSSKNTVKLAE